MRNELRGLRLKYPMTFVAFVLFIGRVGCENFFGWLVL